MATTQVTTIADGMIAPAPPSKAVRGLHRIVIDFTKPENQVAIPNGDTVYIDIAKFDAGTFIRDMYAVVETVQGDALTAEVGDYNVAAASGDADGWIDSATAALNLNSATKYVANGAYKTAEGRLITSTDETNGTNKVSMVITNGTGAAVTLDTGKIHFLFEYDKVY